MVDKRENLETSASDDIRSTLGILASNSRAIIIAAALSFTLATALDVVFGPTYQSSALVSVLEPDIAYQFEPRIVTEMDVPVGEGLTRLALSDEVISSVVRTVGTDSIEPLRDLKDSLDVDVSQSFLELAAKSSDSATAVEVANAWARALTEIVNRLFDETLEDRDFYRIQEATARVEWHDAQEAIVAYQGSNPQLLLQQQLNGVQSELSAHILSDQLLTAVVEDAQAMSARLSSRTPGELIGPRDEFAFLLLLARSQLSSVSTAAVDEDGAGHPINREPDVAIDLVFSTFADDPSRTMTVEQELEQVEVFIESLNDQRIGVASKLEAAQLEIFGIQADLSAADVEMNRLEVREFLAREEYLAVARKLEEAELVLEGQADPAIIASLATEPSERIDPPAIVIGGAALLLGLMGSSIWILMIGWWHENRENSRNQEVSI